MEGLGLIFLDFRFLGGRGERSWHAEGITANNLKFSDISQVPGCIRM